MKLSTLYHIVRADFYERFRRYSTLIIIGLAIYVTYMYLPSIHGDYVTLHMNGFRGIYNSAWVGAIVTILTVMLVPLPGFYLVKNAIERDRRTGVGQILATTPLTKWQYILGKMISNWTFLGAVAGVILIAAMVMQLIRGEDLTLNPGGYLLPYLFLTLPMMALIAALAVLFESMSWLRSTLGNILFFFFYVFGLTALAMFMMPILRQIVIQGTTSTELWEPTGAFIAFKSMFIAGKAASPAFQGGLVIGSTPVSAIGAIKSFVWNGIEWNASYLVERLAVLALAVALVLLAAWVFDRFDQTVETKSRGKAAKVAPAADERPVFNPPPVHVSAANLTKARPATLGPSFARLVTAELRVMVQGLPWWWYLVAVGLWVAGLVASPEQARSLVLPFAWLWPLALWSGLGNRDVRHRTQALFLSAPSPIGRQLLAGWTAGFLVALIAGSSVGVRLALAGEWGALASYVAAILFVPAFALALGIWTGSSKPFEVLYLVLWYLGPMNQVPGLDFIGVNSQSLPAMAPLYYLGFSAVLLGAAVLGRVRQLQMA